MKKIQFIISLMLLLVVISSCESDFLDTTAEDLVSEDQLEQFASESPENLLLVLLARETAQYVRFKDRSFGLPNCWYFSESMTDNLTIGTNPGLNLKNAYDFKTRRSGNPNNAKTFTFHYKTIFDVNSTIEFMDRFALTEEALTTVLPIRSRLRALRAFSYFELIRKYQQTYIGSESLPGLPRYLVLDDVIDDDKKKRGTVQDVYDIILADIEFAYNNIGDYTRPNKEVLNKRVIAGLYARILLETGLDYNKAATMAQEAQTEGGIMNEDQWHEGFTEIDNPEWLWGGDRDDAGTSSWAFDLANTNWGVHWGPFIDNMLYDNMPATDYRKDLFSPTNVSYKIDPPGSSRHADYVYMRVSEMILLEAEALARAGDDAGAASALYSLVSERDSAYVLSANTGDALLEEIYQQRRIELWAEGFGLNDLKRFGKGIVREYVGTNHRPTSELGGVRLNLPARDLLFVYKIPDQELVENDQISESDQNP